MEVIWEPLATVNPENVIRYRFEVAGRLSAERLLKRIDSNVVRLAVNPYIGSRMADMDGLKEEYRSLVTAKIYKLVYRVGSDALYIAALFDCRRDPARLPEELPH